MSIHMRNDLMTFFSLLSVLGSANSRPGWAFSVFSALILSTWQQGQTITPNWGFPLVEPLLSFSPFHSFLASLKVDLL